MGLLYLVSQLGHPGATSTSIPEPESEPEPEPLVCVVNVVDYGGYCADSEVGDEQCDGFVDVVVIGVEAADTCDV